MKTFLRFFVIQLFCISIVTYFGFLAYADGTVIASGNCGKYSDMIWTLDSDGVLTISGSGEMKDYTDASGEWRYYQSDIKEIRIESGVTSIGENAFRGCNLTSVSISNSVKSIGNDAFTGCFHLTNITIPNGVISVGQRAFMNCRNLSTVIIPESVTSFGYWAFYGCDKLISAGPIDSGSNIEFGWTNKIPGYTFSRCNNLTSVIIPEGVTGIGAYAFEDCDKLISAGPIGSGCNIEFGWKTRIPSCLGASFPGLKSIEIPKGVKIIDDSAFSCCYWLTNVTIPDSVISIRDRAFYGCSSLTSVNIPQGIEGIYDQTFKNCRSLINISIPEGVTNIGSEAFSGCTNLTSIQIPNSVSSIGYHAFENCSSLARVVIPSSIETLNTIFAGCDRLESAGPIGSGCNIEFGWKTEIPANSFAGVSKLTNIILPESVTSIGSSAFSGCSSLTSVNIPNSVTSIGSSAFSECASLTSISIPSSVISIGAFAFSSCSKLTSVTIPDSINSISDYTFSGCSGLTSVDIPDSVKSIGNYAFSECSGLTSVSIPASVKEYSFRGCTSLNSLTVYSTVKSIGFQAFDECPELIDIYYEGTPDQWKNIAIDYGNDSLRYAKIHYNAFFCISFEANGGTNAPKSQKKGPSQTLVLTSAIPLREGWYFVGWAESADAEVAIYFPNGDFSADKDTALYAVWKQPDFILPSAIMTLGGETFTKGAFTFVQLPDRAVSIGRRSFADCPNLAYICIPALTTQIDEEAFGSIQSLTILGKTGSAAETYAQNHNFNFIAVP